MLSTYNLYYEIKIEFWDGEKNKKNKKQKQTKKKQTLESAEKEEWP